MSTTALARLQRQFMGRLLDIPGDASTGEIAHGRMPHAVGLRIYTHAYGARLREALEHDHPVLGRYLGDDLWDQLCRGYVSAHPSRHRSLRDFGADLPAWLAHAEPFRLHPQIAELAGFERSLLNSFDAADEAHADWQGLVSLQDLDWPALTLRFHPSLRLHAVAHNSVETWQALKEDRTPPPAAVAVDTTWALWRDGDRISRFRSLDRMENAAVAHCRNGGNFADLCELLLAWHAHEAVPAIALRYLQTWAGEDWIAHWN